MSNCNKIIPNIIIKDTIDDILSINCCKGTPTPTSSRGITPTPTITPTVTPSKPTFNYISSFTPFANLSRVNGNTIPLSITLIGGAPTLYYRWNVRPSGGNNTSWISCDDIGPGYDYYGIPGGNSWPLPHSSSLSIGYYTRDISPGRQDPSLYNIAAPTVTDIYNLNGAEFKINIYSDSNLSNYVEQSPVMKLFLINAPTPTPTPTLTPNIPCPDSYSGCPCSLIRNGRFEDGTQGSSIGGGTADGWVSLNSIGGIIPSSSSVDFQSLSYLFPSEPFNRWVDLNSCSPGNINQTFITKTGDTYRVNFKVSANNAGARGVKQGSVVVFSDDIYDSQSISERILYSGLLSFDSSLTTYGTYDSMGWRNETFTFVSNYGIGGIADPGLYVPTTIRFQGETLGTCHGLAIDDVCVFPTGAITPTPTPTPTTTPPLVTLSITPTVTPTITESPTLTPTITVTPTISNTPTITTTPTVTPTVTESPTPTVTPSRPAVCSGLCTWTWYSDGGGGWDPVGNTCIPNDITCPCDTPYNNGASDGVIVNTYCGSAIWGETDSNWDTVGFSGNGTINNPFTATTITTYQTTILVRLTGYIKYSWDTLTLSGGCSGNDNFEITRTGGANTVSYQCQSNVTGSMPITANQILYLGPDSTATFSNLKIWWSATV
jgi:hypothetical protein